MTPAQKIAELAEQGYDVRIFHARRYLSRTGQAAKLTKKEHQEPRIAERFPNGPEPKGGVTVAEILWGGTLHSVGFAECSLKDNYNKRLGAQIALGRAAKKIERR